MIHPVIKLSLLFCVRHRKQSMLYEAAVMKDYSHVVVNNTCLEKYREPAEIQQKWLTSNVADIADFFQIPRSPAFLSQAESFQHVHFKAGQRIFISGEKADALYLVNSGFTKSLILDESGNEQVVNFQMKGNILGVDGIHGGEHHSEAVALADSDIILLPIKKLKALSHTFRQFDNAMLNLLSMELVHQQNRLCLLAARNAEVRVANFLLNLAERFFALGYSRSIFNLRMTRNDLGSYLGLSLETVSRTLSFLHASGWIDVNNRGIIIRDELSLKNLTGIRKGITRN